MQFVAVVQPSNLLFPWGGQEPPSNTMCYWTPQPNGI